MKSRNIKWLAMSLLAAGLAGCSENSWNDTYLDGFTEPPVSSGATNIEIKLSAADYKSIANNSTNKALAEAAGEADQLAAIEKNLAFPSEEAARKYLPAFISASDFPYFNLNNGSSIKIAYDVTGALPAIVEDINAGVEQYAVSKDEYIAVWESDDNFIQAFAPEKPASANIPGILLGAFPDAAADKYAVVSYNESETNPIFGTIGGDDPQPPVEWTMTDVIKDVAVNDELNIRGVVTGISTRGFIVTDLAGSICFDKGNGFSDPALKIGSQVNVSGTVGVYSRCLQISVNNSYEIVGEQEYEYPAPVSYDGAMVNTACEGTGDFLAQYISLDGVTVSVSGNYFNLNIPGSNYIGSVYYAPEFIKSHLSDKAVVNLTGYFVCVSGSQKYFNILVTGIDGVNISSAPMIVRAPAVEPVTVSKNAIYKFDGSKWVAPANTIVLQPSDYTAMGQSYGNLSNDLPDTLLPEYLRLNRPYASEGEAYTIVYKYYGGGATNYQATQFVLTEGNWVRNNGVVESKDQFTRKDNTWSYNPSVEMTLEKSSDIANTIYYACVDWVYENISLKMDPGCAITDAPFIYKTRANAEYYSGASAYYGNVDVRASTATNNAPEGYTGYDGLSEDEITLLIKKRFCTETLKGALEKVYSDMAPVAGMEVTYSVTFISYDGGNTDITNVYSVSGPGELKYVSSTWFENGEDADW